MQQQQQGKELSPKGASLLSDSPAAAEGADGPLGQTARKSLSRLGDFRPGSSSSNSAQHSVRSLIESIENASKQAKGPSSRSSSTSSLNSLASDSRSAAAGALLLGNPTDLLGKPNLKMPAEKTRLQCRQSQQQQQQRLDGTPETTSESLQRTEPEKVTPMSILSHKLEPIRRNSYR